MGNEELREGQLLGLSEPQCLHLWNGADHIPSGHLSGD